MTNQKTKSDLIRRLNILKGQLDGIKRMIEEENPNCIDVFTQIKAARSGINKVGQKILQGGIMKCVKQSEDEKELEKILGAIVE